MYPGSEGTRVHIAISISIKNTSLQHCYQYPVHVYPGVHAGIGIPVYPECWYAPILVLFYRDRRALII